MQMTAAAGTTPALLLRMVDAKIFSRLADGCGLHRRRINEAGRGLTDEEVELPSTRGSSDGVDVCDTIRDA